jgi:hypothetical protein
MRARPGIDKDGSQRPHVLGVAGRPGSAPALRAHGPAGAAPGDNLDHDRRRRELAPGRRGTAAPIAGCRRRVAGGGASAVRRQYASQSSLRRLRTFDGWSAGGAATRSQRVRAPLHGAREGRSQGPPKGAFAKPLAHPGAESVSALVSFTSDSGWAHASCGSPPVVLGDAISRVPLP